METKRAEFQEVLDVTRIMHMLQKKHIITPQLEAIVLADPGFAGRVDRLLDMLMTRGSQVSICLQDCGEFVDCCMAVSGVVGCIWHGGLYLAGWVWRESRKSYLAGRVGEGRGSRMSSRC